MANMWLLFKVTFGSGVFIRKPLLYALPFFLPVSLFIPKAMRFVWDFFSEKAGKPHRFGFILFFLFTLFISLSIFAQESSTYVFCSQKSFVRTIRVERGANGCRTIYTKKGVDKEVGTGLYLESCMRFLENIRKNLVAAGWKCRDVSQSKISQDSDQE